MTMQAMPSEEQEFSTEESSFSDGASMDSPFDVGDSSFSDSAPEDQGFDDTYSESVTQTSKKSDDGASMDSPFDVGDSSFSDSAPEDQGFDDAYSENVTKTAKKRGDGASNDVFYDGTPSEDQSFSDNKKKDSKGKRPWMKWKDWKKYNEKKDDKNDDSNGPEDQYFGEPTRTLEPPSIYDKMDHRGRRVDDTYQDVLVGDTMGQDYDNDTIPYSLDTNHMISEEDYSLDFSIDQNPGYGNSERLDGLRSQIRESLNRDSRPIEDQYLSSVSKKPIIYRPVEHRGRRIDDTYQDVLVGDTMGQDYDNDTLPYSVDQNIDVNNNKYDINFRGARYRRGYSNIAPEDQYLEHGNRYPVIYDEIDESSYPINDTYTDVLFSPILGQDYDNDGVPYALENSGYIRADEYETIDRDNPNNDDTFGFSNEMINDDYGYGNEMPDRYGGRVPIEDQYLSSASIRPPEIHQNPEYPPGTPINNTYNDIIFNDTLGQDYDDDGMPYALETKDLMREDDYNIDFQTRNTGRSERLRELRNGIRESINSSAMPEDQYFASRDMGTPDNPFDATNMDPHMRPRIYAEMDKRGYAEDDTIGDVVFGDTLGQDYDNDGVPYALETMDQMDANYSSVFGMDYDNKPDRDKYMNNKYNSSGDIMADNYGSVFEGKKRETAVSNIRRNLGNRFQDSTNDTIASEIARNRLSRRMERTDNAERSAERSKILEDARAFGRGKSMFNGKRSGRGRIDDYVMGDYEPSPVASTSYDSDTSLSNGVAARAMREARFVR